MLDPDFWRDLAKEFRSIDPAECVYATWRRDKQTGLFYYDIHKTDEVCESAWYRFIALATRAGATYPPDDGADACSIWLHEVNKSILKKEPSSMTSDGTLVGRISRVTEASANLCSRFEAQFLNRNRSQRRLQGHAHSAQHDVANVSDAAQQPGTKTPSLSSQLERLRKRARLTVEKLAEELGLQPRSVYRHLGGTIPRPGHLSEYERVFTKHLGEAITLEQPSPKRQ